MGGGAATQALAGAYQAEVIFRHIERQIFVATCRRVFQFASPGEMHLAANSYLICCRKILAIRKRVSPNQELFRWAYNSGGVTLYKDC